jgi:exoribonuclease R
MQEANMAQKELTQDAQIVDVKFTKSVIASKYAFTYEEAQIRKDDPYVKVLAWCAWTLVAN